MASRSEGSHAATPSRVLITGLQGFTGRYLADLLTARGHEVHGTAVHDGRTPAGEPANGRVHAADLCDLATLQRVIDAVRPQHVVHLAAIAFVAHGDVESIYRTNVIGTRNLLEALGAVSPNGLRSVLLASSANVYGNALAEPIDEDTPPRPANDYAVSKLSMEYMAELWLERLPITIVRPFNYTGVGQSVQFLVPKIVDAFRRRAAHIELGNIDVERDFSDVRDVVEAYSRLLEAPPGGVFNVCSGEVHSLSRIIELAAEISGHSLSVHVNPAFVRANDVKRLRGSNERLRGRIGEWGSRPIRATVEWMLAAGEAGR